MNSNDPRQRIPNVASVTIPSEKELKKLNLKLSDPHRLVYECLTCGGKIIPVIYAQDGTVVTHKLQGCAKCTPAGTTMTLSARTITTQRSAHGGES